MLKLYNVRIMTWLGIYGQIYPSAFRSSPGLRPREFLQAERYIWPYFPPLVLIRIQYIVNLKVEANKKFLIGFIKLRRNPLSKCCIVVTNSPSRCLRTCCILPRTQGRGEGKGEGGLNKHCDDSFCPNVPKSPKSL